jgi:hypothetical protein
MCVTRFKLTSCNHRLKAAPPASANQGEETTCVGATGREEIRVCNTRLKEETSNGGGSRHAEATTEGQ